MQNDIGKDLQSAYDDGYEQGVKDFAKRVKNYYHHLSGKTLPAAVEYHINQIANEMLQDLKE